MTDTPTCKAAERLTSSTSTALLSTPEVSAKACLDLANTLQLCNHCSSNADSGKVDDVAPLAQQLVAALHLHSSDASVQVAGLHLALKLTGCTTCRLPSTPERQDVLGATGLVPAAAAALAVLSAPVPAEAAELQQRSAGISYGLRALHNLCGFHAANLNHLAAASGVHVVGSATAAAPADPLAEEHSLLLLTHLACREAASVEEQQAAAVAVWQAAQAQVQLRHPEVSRAAVWCMAQLLRRMLPFARLGAAAEQLLAELQVQGVALVLALLQGGNLTDEALINRCLDFLALVGPASKQLASAPPALAAMLGSPSGAVALRLAHQQRHEACIQLLEGMQQASLPQPLDAAALVAASAELSPAKVQAHMQQQQQQQQQLLGLRRQAQQARQAAYEQALEQQRQQLDAAAAAAVPSLQQQAVGGEEASSVHSRRVSSEGSEGRDQPGTPDQQEDQPTTPSAQAAAAGGSSSGGEPASSTSGGGEGSSSAGNGDSLDSVCGGLASEPQAPTPPRRQQGQRQAQPQGQQARQLMPHSPFGADLDAGRSLAGLSAATSMYSEPGCSLFGSPSLSNSVAGTGPSGSPQAAFSITGSGPFGGSASPAPYTSPSPGPAPLHSRSGLPPLPGRPHAFGAALAAAAGPNGTAAAAVAAVAADRDRLLSIRLQDALFVGSPSPSAPNPGHQQSSPRHHSLFASLSASDGDGEGDGEDGNSSHLLSSSLSCLDDGPMIGRTSSSSSPGSGSPITAAAAAAEKQLAAFTAADALMNGTWGGADGGTECQRGTGPDLNSDESPEPTRHLWIGNLGTRTPRALLKTLFERFGTVDDVVTFPGRMYAFVNYRSTEEALLAYASLQDQQVPELTGDRKLLIKYRPAKKAAVHLRALGLLDDDGLPTEERLDLDRDGNSSEPSPRIWLGNIAPTATSRSLHTVLGRFGVLTDAAVFPARIGPLGYAFVKFERVEDAVHAFEALNNTVVSPLSGSKQLKMRYKPANDGPATRGEDPADSGKAVMVPSRHLWLGNITQKPTDEQVLEMFASFGKVDSVRVFPVKAYAFVNYADIGSAIRAMQTVDGLAIPHLTGVKPLVMRYQQESGGSAASTPKPSGSVCSSSTSLLPRVASEAAALSAALGFTQPLPGSGLASLLAGGMGSTAVGSTAIGSTAVGSATSADGSGSDDGLMPVPNLSNKLNPNNIHYDAELAERYKHMSRREKDLMWAADSLLHPADAAKGLLRSGSMGLLGGTPAAAAAAPALAAAGSAQAQAAMAALLQQQQADGLAGAIGGSGAMLTSQLLALHQLAPNQPAPPAQQSQLPTGASASQLTAVLNNLTAMRRTGSMPGSSPAPGAAFQLHPQQLPNAHSLPVMQPQHHSSGSLHSLGFTSPPPPSGQAYLQQMLLQQQQQSAGGCPAHLASFDGSSTSGSVLGSQSYAGGTARVSTPVLPNVPLPSPCSSGPLPLLQPHNHLVQSPRLPPAQLPPQLSPQLPPPQQQLPAHSLAAALGQLAAQAASQQHLAAAPPSPGSHSIVHGGGNLPAGNLPPQFYCPLTQQPMTDPVLAADGITYERHAISEWLAYKDVSPTTHMLMPHKVLTPNVVLRAALLDVLRQQVC
ncbi:Flowering time control protein FPA [Chlorella vulgaris]